VNVNTAADMILWAVAAGAVLGGLVGAYVGAAHAHYRHARQGGHPRRAAARLSRAGVWVSLPLPGGFRVGRRL